MAPVLALTGFLPFAAARFWGEAPTRTVDQHHDMLQLLSVDNALGGAACAKPSDNTL